MIRYELKKVVNAKSLLCLLAINILFLAIFQVQLKGVRQAKSTATAAFFIPLISTEPTSGFPPLIIYLSIM